MPTPSFESADSALIEEVISQAEVRLQAQLTLALAADQRAMTFAGLLFAGVAVLVALGTQAAETISGRAEIPCVAAGFLIAAGLACWSARPVSWHSPGNFPSSWNDDVAAGLQLRQTRAETAANYEKLLQDNEASLRHAAGFMRGSVYIAIVTATAGVLATVL